jgi:hypothetical protein
MGYAEATFLLFAIGTFYAMRRKWWWLAALLGVLAGLTRPLGALLAVPAAIECARAWNFRSPTRSKHLGSLAAVLGGPVGCGAFMAFAGLRYGDAFAPLRIQQEAGHRGAIADPLRTLGHDASLLVHGQHLGTALHLPWVVLALVLAFVAAARWPAPYAAFAFCVLAVALTARFVRALRAVGLPAHARRGEPVQQVPDRDGGLRSGSGRPGGLRSTCVHGPLCPVKGLVPGR